MRADGTRFPVEVHSASFVHDGRKCLVAVARDLSGRHEAEIRYRELMEVIDKGIVIQDEARRLHLRQFAPRCACFGVGEGESLDDAMQPGALDAGATSTATMMPEGEYPTIRAMQHRPGSSKARCSGCTTASAGN